MSKVGRNDPCPCGSGKKYKFCCYDHRVTAASGALALAREAAPAADEPWVGASAPESGPDPIAAAEFDALLRTVAGKRSVRRGEPMTPEERADDLVEQAYATSGRRREKLVRQALSVFPDCVDAYVLLGDQIAGTPEQALGYYQQAIAAARRTLGPERLDTPLDDDWEEGVDSYLRARFGLAQALAALDRRDEAIGHLQELLRRDPEDELGALYQLLTDLLRLDRVDEADVLIRRYPGDWSTRWRYDRALVKFRRFGDVPSRNGS